MNPTYKPVFPLIKGITFKTFFFIFGFLLLAACSADEEGFSDAEESVKEEKDLSQKIDENADSELSVYKGIFASAISGKRGTFKLLIPGGVKDLSKVDTDAIGTLQLSSGETFEAKATGNLRSYSDNEKSADVKVEFDSQDFSFTFTVDEYNNPIISDVVFKNQDGSIIAAEETPDNTITPVTGTYKCTNCQDQDSPLNGIDLNNNERIFNMLLTTADGTTSISVQALVGILIDTKVVTQQSCSNNGDYTFCVLKNGENAVNENLTWSGVHRYTSNGLGEDCSSLAGNFAFAYAGFGVIEGEFLSDSTCPNKTYFVSNSGEDSNTGLSPEDPWKSISRVNSIDVQPGDRILFEGGQEYSGNLYLDQNDANNSANPVLISTFGNGKAKIIAGDSFGIYAYNTSGIKVDNLIFEGSGMNSNSNSGIYFYNDLPGDVKLDFIEVTNTEVYGFRDYGIVVGGWNGNSGFTNVLIENNKVHDCLDVGISSYGEFSSNKTGYANSNLTVRSCEVYNIKGYDKGKHSGNGILLSDVQNSVIEHSTVYNCGSGNTNCGGPVGIWYWDADQVTIQYSEVYNMSSGSGCDGAGFDLDGGVTNGLMQYNYSHDNDGAGFMAGQFGGARPMKNLTIRYNISQNDAATNGGSVYLFNGDDSMSDVYIYNNTLYLSEQSTNKAAATIKYTYWKPVKYNINFYNNILYAANGADLVDIPAGYDGYFSGNLYYSPDNFSIKYKGVTYNSLESFRSTGNEMSQGLPVGYEGDPLLTNAGNGGTIGFGNSLADLAAYKLQSSSPAIGLAIEVSQPGSRDFYGNNFSGIPDDIGAYQFADSSKNHEIAVK